MRALSLGAALAAALPLTGQVSARLDLGVGGREEGRGGGSTWSVAPMVHWHTPQSRVELSGEYRDGGTGGRGAGGIARGSWFQALAHPLRLELTTEARGQHGLGRAARGAGDAGVRLHLAGADRGLWLGAHVGADPSGGTTRWEAAAWRRLGPFSLQLSGRQSNQGTPGSSTGRPPADTFPPIPDTLQAGGTRSSRVVTDLGSWLGWQGRRVQLTGGAGFRMGQVEPATSLVPGDGGLQNARGRTRSEGWWFAELSYWMTDRLALAGSAGRQLGDPALLTPSGQFFRLSLRASLGRRLPVARPEAHRPRLHTARLATGLVEFSLAAEGVDAVELMGDLTDWRAVRMDRGEDGRWRVRLPVPPGLYQVNVRFDGGPWRVPPGARAITDEFGTASGVVMVR